MKTNRELGLSKNGKIFLVRKHPVRKMARAQGGKKPKGKLSWGGDASMSE